MTAKFIHKGKEIHQFTQEFDLPSLPKKDTYINIKEKDYLIIDFSFSSDLVLYRVIEE